MGQAWANKIDMWQFYHFDLVSQEEAAPQVSLANSPTSQGSRLTPVEDLHRDHGSLHQGGGHLSKRHLPNEQRHFTPKAAGIASLAGRRPTTMNKNTVKIGSSAIRE
jgi:hypothetical protein